MKYIHGMGGSRQADHVPLRGGDVNGFKRCKYISSSLVIYMLTGHLTNLFAASRLFKLAYLIVRYTHPVAHFVC